MKEKLQEYALFAEIISAACIVLSLIFVGLQVRLGAEETAANTEAIRSSVRQAMMETDKDLALSQAELDAAFILAGKPLIRDGENLTPEEQAIITNGNIAYIRSRQHYWSEYKAGLLDYDTYRGYMTNFALATGENSNVPSRKNLYESSLQFGILPREFGEDLDKLREEIIASFRELNESGN